MRNDLKEDLLHYCWQFKKWKYHHLKTTNNEQVEILATGFSHQNSGPDFVNAKLKIGETIWSGNVEIHVRASDWQLHHHQTDKAYDNVILHVVAFADTKVFRTDGTEIPTVEVADVITENIWSQYTSFIHSKEEFPCAGNIHLVPILHQNLFLNRVVVERLESKSKQFLEILSQTNNQWEESLYIWLARAFGFKVNAFPFELLARSIPQKLYAKYKSDPLYIEALIFGNAGFLDINKEQDLYTKQLFEIYDFLRKKHNLKPLDVSVWKFLRLRPSNFPTRRLAQFSAFIYKSQHLFSKVLDIEKGIDYKAFFEKLPVQAYWKTHYRFGVETRESSVQLGVKSVEQLILNAAVVFLFTYGKYFSQQDKVERALNLLEILKPEHNHITKMYSNKGVKIDNALHSQAILQLHSEYCNLKKCFLCGIGVKLIK